MRKHIPNTSPNPNYVVQANYPGRLEKSVHYGYYNKESAYTTGDPYLTGVFRIKYKEFKKTVLAMLALISLTSCMEDNGLDGEFCYCSEKVEQRDEICNAVCEQVQ